MKHFITLFIASLISLSCWAQVEIKGEMANTPCKLTQNKIIDVSSIECIYSHTITDTINIDIRYCFEMLQIGNNLSHYAAYGEYRVDSVLNHMNTAGLTLGEFASIHNKYNDAKNRDGYTIVVKDKKLNQINVYDKVFIDRYKYNEPIPNFNWSLSNGTSTICGYKCKKATCHFRGRQWTAWYTEDIPVIDGPWKFSGLPGLILHIEDSNAEHVFSATEIRNSNTNITLGIYDFIKTTRDRFNAELKDYKENARQYIAGSVAAPKNTDGTPARIPKRRMFFNPIELE